MQKFVIQTLEYNSLLKNKVKIACSKEICDSHDFLSKTM